MNSVGLWLTNFFVSLKNFFRAYENVLKWVNYAGQWQNQNMSILYCSIIDTDVHSWWTKGSELFGTYTQPHTGADK